jgi:hypothetical protein
VAAVGSIRRRLPGRTFVGEMRRERTAASVRFQRELIALDREMVS